MFVVVNPFTLVPVFLGITQHESPSSRRRIAIRSVVIAAVILIASIVIGEILLKAMGVSLSSFRIAGGIVLLVISMKLILEEEPGREPADEGNSTGVKSSRDVSVFPLAMPFI